MITCVVDYTIDPAKVAAFERFARAWIGLVTGHGGQLTGYFLPGEGASDKALALFSFPSLAAYETYRSRFGVDPEFIAADKIRDESGCVLRYERTFMRPLLSLAAVRRASWQDADVRTHVALLRGVNVGGRNKLAMSDLREITASLGHADVTTYIQSGNVLFTSSETDTARLADALEQAIADRLGLRPAVVVVSRDQLADVIAANPYPPDTDPRRLHAVFRRAVMTPAEVAAVTEAQQRAAGQGSRDDATVIGATLYLNTPEGIGRSELAAQLARNDRKTPPGTARNWATVTKLLALLDG